jgi:hypothetical protein
MELPWTQDAMGAWSFNAAGVDPKIMGALCNDQYYLNVHTTDEPNGEVRANCVGMAVTCNIKDYVADGTATTYGVEPADGTVQNFCITYIGSPVAGSTGNCEITGCWNGIDQITISGCCYGLTSDVDEITCNYPEDTYEYISFSYYDFPSGCPFSFRYISTDEWIIAKFTSGKSTIDVTTAASNTVEIIVDIVGEGADFPVSTKPCRPYTGDVPAAGEPLDCYFGYDDYQTSSACSYDGYLCAIYDFVGDEYKTCISYNYCYDCDCGASVVDDLPSSGYACCDFTDCNAVSLDVLNCIGGSASFMSSAILFALFGTLIMIWFN